MAYVDGYVIPIPKKNIAAYQRMARKCSVVFKDHGALEFRECVGEDLRTKCGVPFTKLAKLKRGETVLFSWVIYKSRVHRDRAMKATMKDPRLAKMMDMSKMPFDIKRFSYAGFRVIVDA